MTIPGRDFANRRNLLRSADEPPHPYAWAVLAGHFVVWLFLHTSGLLVAATEGIEPYCWPYFENCWKFRIPTPGLASAATWAYLCLGAVAALALGHRRTRIFYLSLILLNVYLFALVSVDYRLRANEFYMLFWINGVYILTRPTRWTIPVTILSFYFWAGRLKLNEEWLSGQLLYAELWFTPSWAVSYACAYVVVLEMLFIWGLLSTRKWVVSLTLAQLALFHLESLSQIHWFYPALMASILAWFPIQRGLEKTEAQTKLGLLFTLRAPLVTYAVMGLFAVAQLWPAFKGPEPELTGDGRAVALHMFEARQDCRVTAVRGAEVGAAPLVIDLKQYGLSPRMICDPTVYFSRAKALCRRAGAQTPTWDFRFLMTSKRSTDAQFTTIIDEADFCSSNYEFEVFARNPWLWARPFSAASSTD